jgi:hypothetical protein
MKKYSLLTIIAVVILAMTSCDVKNNTETKTAGAALQPNDSIFTVNEGGYNFQIILPKDMMIANVPEISMNGATGDLHIHLGEQFWIVASQEKMDMNAIKSAINDDMLFTNRIVEETNNSILFQRILPDGTTYDFNFRSFSEVGGKPYLFKTSEEGEFSIESVNRMRQAISSVHQNV